MSLIRKTIIIALVLWTQPAVAATIQDKDLPKVKTIEIQDQVTRMIVDILPGRGVQCIFPWILDETNAKTPYKCTITNGDVFELERGEKQNFLVFKINGQARGEQLEGEVSDGFISVAGYYFNLTLRVNFSKSAHYSTIIFQIIRCPACRADRRGHSAPKPGIGKTICPAGKRTRPARQGTGPAGDRPDCYRASRENRYL